MAAQQSAHQADDNRRTTSVCAVRGPSRSTLSIVCMRTRCGDSGRATERCRRSKRNGSVGMADEVRSALGRPHVILTYREVVSVHSEPEVVPVGYTEDHWSEALILATGDDTSIRPKARAMSSWVVTPARPGVEASLLLRIRIWATRTSPSWIT